MNKKVLSKIYDHMVAQYPPQQLYAAINTLDNLYKKERIMIRTCLINNSSCSNQNKKSKYNQAIDSHSIPKKNLENMCTNTKVYASKSDPTNPFKREIYKSALKSTLTFWGFCTYHDKNLFKLLEDNDTNHYSNEMVFLLAYRALAKSYCDVRETVERLKWDTKSWNIDERKKLRIELIKFELERSKIRRNYKCCLAKINHYIKKIWLSIKYKYIGKIETLQKSHFFTKQLLIQKNKLKEYNTLIESNATYDSQYVVLKNKKSIAFSITFSCVINKQDGFIYITALPTSAGSDIIVSCSLRDYVLINEDAYIIKIFQGEQRTINEVLNMFKDNIAHAIENSETDFANQFFLEWDIPLAQIKYYKPAT